VLIASPLGQPPTPIGDGPIFDFHVAGNFAVGMMMGVI